jgi:hypothetical protein
MAKSIETSFPEIDYAGLAKELDLGTPRSRVVRKIVDAAIAWDRAANKAEKDAAGERIHKAVNDLANLKKT